MKKYIMFFISIGLILGIILFYKVMSIDKNRKTVFNESGYILNGQTDRYYFNKEEKYTTTYNDKIVFNDTEGAKVTVDNDNFVHYQSGNIEGLIDGVLLDLGKIDDNLIIYYNIKANKEVKKVSDRYIIKNLENDLQFDQAIWKISANKYIILGNSIKFKLDDGTEKEVNGYIEIEFFEDEISNVNSEKGKINIYNQEISYMTSIKDDKYIELNDDIKLNIGTKIVSKKGQNKMSLEDMVINSNDNVTLVDIDEKEENTVEENKVDENTTENNAGDNTTNNNNNTNNNSSTTTNNNTNNSTTGGTTNNGGSTININTPDIKYVESNGKEEQIDVSKTVKEPKFKLENMNVTALGIKGNIKIVDEDDLLSKEEEINIRIVNNSTGKLVYTNSVVYGNSYDIDLDCETLLPDTQYTIVVTATYIVNETPYTKNFIYKTFATSNIGISIKKAGHTDESLNFDVSIEDELVKSAKVYLLDSNGNNIKDDNGENIYKIINNSNKTINFNKAEHKIESNTQYKIKVSDISYNGPTQEGNSWEIYYDDCKTLKQIPKIELNYSINKREGKVNLSIEKVEDKDNAIQNYTYVVYKVKKEDTETENFDTSKIIYQKETKEKEISIDVKNDTNEGSLIRGELYGYKVIINSYDNEKYVESETPIKGTFGLNTKDFPTIQFTKDENNGLTATSIKGMLRIIDEDKTIICDKDHPLEIKWEDRTGNNGEIETIKSAEDLNTILDKGYAVNMTGLKSFTTYTISVYGSIDLGKDSQDQTNKYENILIGSHIETTKNYNPLRTTYTKNESSTATFALNFKLDGDEIEKESLNSITFLLQEGDTYNNNASPIGRVTITKDVVNEYTKYAIDKTNKINSLQELLCDSGIILTPSMLTGKAESNFNAKQYIVLASVTIDGTPYKNKIPLKCDTERTETLSTGEMTYYSNKQKTDEYTYTATFATIKSKRRQQSTKNLLKITKQYDENDTYITGYNVEINWNNMEVSEDEVEYIQYYVYDANWENPIKENTKEIIIKKDENQKTKAAYFEVKPGTLDSIETDNKNGLHRGGAYNFWCSIKLTTGDIWYTDFSEFKALGENPQRPNKIEPTVVMYPTNLEKEKDSNPSMTFKYAIDDPDYAIERNGNNYEFYLYNCYNTIGTYIDNATLKYNDDNSITFQYGYIDSTEYQIKYRKVLNKTNKSEKEENLYSTGHYKYEEFIGADTISKEIGYEINYESKDNPNIIRIDLTESKNIKYLDKIAAIKAIIKNKSGEKEDTNLMKIENKDNEYYVEIDMQTMKNPEKFTGTINIDLIIYYDTNQIGFNNERDANDYVTFVSPSNEYNYQIFEKGRMANNIRGNIYKLIKFDENELTLDLENINNSQVRENDGELIKLLATSQGLEYNSNTLIAKKIGNITLSGKTVDIDTIMAGIELPEKNRKTDFTTATLTPKLTKYGLNIKEIYCNLYYKNVEGLWEKLEDKKKTIDMTDKEDIGEIKFENLTIATNYMVKFTYKLNEDETEYNMYGVDTKTVDPEYEFNTVANIGIDNLKVEYIPISYDNKTLRITYSIGKDNQYVYNMYNETEYSFYKKGKTTPVKIALKGKTDLDTKVVVTNDSNNYYNGDKNKRVLELNVSPEYNNFDFGEEYEIKIIPIVKYEDGREPTRIGEDLEYNIKISQLKDAVILPKIIKTYKEENKIDNKDKIKINISISDESKLIVDGNYTIQAERFLENATKGESVNIVDIDGNTIKGPLTTSEINKILYIDNCDYTKYKYVVTWKHKVNNKNMKGQETEVTNRKTIDLMDKIGADLGEAVIQKEDDGSLSVICDGGYNLETINVAQYTIRDIDDNSVKSNGQVKIEKSDWIKKVNNDEVRYSWKVPFNYDKNYIITIKFGIEDGKTIRWLEKEIENRIFNQME